jgi:hypothetical protein
MVLRVTPGVLALVVEALRHRGVNARSDQVCVLVFRPWFRLPSWLIRPAALRTSHREEDPEQDEELHELQRDGDLRHH